MNVHGVAEEISNTDLKGTLQDVQNLLFLCSLSAYVPPPNGLVGKAASPSINPSHANLQHLLNTSLALSPDFFALFWLHVFLSLNFWLILWQCLLLKWPWHLCLFLQFLSLNVFSILIQHFVYGHMTVEDLAISYWNKSSLPPLRSAKTFNLFNTTHSACHGV